MTVSAHDIEVRLTAVLQPVALTVQDDSHLHAGHAGAREGRHFSVRIVSARFDGLSRVARHRLVYGALQPLMAQGIHALAIDAITATATALESNPETELIPVPAVDAKAALG